MAEAVTCWQCSKVLIAPDFALTLSCLASRCHSAGAGREAATATVSVAANHLPSRHTAAATTAGSSHVWKRGKPAAPQAPQACRCSAGQRLTQSAFQMVSMRWPSVHCKVPARGTQGSGARCLSPKPNARAAACRAVQLMHVHHSWSQLDRPFASARCAPVWKLSIVSEVTGQEDEGGNGGRGGGGGAFAAQLSGRVEGMGMIPVSSRKKRVSGADRHCNSPGSMALCAQLQLQRLWQRQRQRHAHRGSGFWLRPKHMCLSRTRRTACRQGQLASELAAANCNPVTVATVHALTCRRTPGSGQPQPRGTCGTASAGEGR